MSDHPTPRRISRDDDRPDVGAIEAVYGMEFTDEERRLLTRPMNALTPIEKQKRELLIMATRGVHCPRCRGLICRRAACQVPFTAMGSVADDAYACPFCFGGLVWHLGLTGEEWFTLAPGQVEPS